jgi:aminomethyltransferase
MGEIWVRGKGAHALLQRLSSNDIDLLSPGMAQYTCFPNGKGGIVDDLIVHRYGEMQYLLVVNAANVEKDHNWLLQHNTSGAEIENASGKTSQLAIQGPNALKVLQSLSNVDLKNIAHFHFSIGSVGVLQDVIIAATGYTGAGGYELYFHSADALPVWDQLLEAGKELGLKPVGLAARDTLRLEMGYCLYGNDIDDSTSPIEAGLGWITKVHEGKDLIDKAYLEKQKRNGVGRKLAGFEMIDRGIPRQHYEILDPSGHTIGRVTSGTMSPTLKTGIGLGYVAVPWNKPSGEILIRIRSKLLRARIVKLPFVH